ncbi:MAG TPA: pitrilysin family protein [Acidimicrobiales bacterium]|nr:pitrilysin family protein [Acidimicrobiales bacterium]
MIETTELDSGITVVTERIPWVRSVSAGFWVGTGSRDEGPGLFGASHFLEHLLFKGTATRSARRIAEDVDAVGGDMNAFTTKEYTAFYLRVLDDSLDLGLDILSDILWSPAFRPEEVEAERQVILEEILMRADEPADFVHEVFTEALFPDHPVGREVLGDEESIEAMSRDDIAAFHAHHYRPGNVVFAAAGLVDHGAVVDGVARRFAGPMGGASPDRAVPVAPPRPLAVDERPTEQVHLVLGVRSLDRHDEDRYALAVVNHVLGGGLSSRLFQKVREERGLAYSVYSYRSAFADSGALAVYAGTMPSRVEEVVGLVRAELDDMAGTGITDRELEVAKGHLVGEMALSLEDSAARMSRIGRSQLVHGTVLTFDEVAARIAGVTLDDVARVAAGVLGNERVLAAVGPVDHGKLDAPRVA